jgi:2-methylisocitrate lyase-like PEP mutase family enzyme
VAEEMSTMTTQVEKARHFRALHQAPGAFVIANVWDGASAAVMAALGFEALATSSAACAATLGKLDGEITRAQAIEHARLIAALSDLPLSGDLENGFGAAPEDAAETIREAAAAGLVGGSIEDASGDARAPIYEFARAVERVAAAAEAAHRLPFPFLLTARTENYFNGRPDLDDTVRRLAAFERAGADVLFAPGLPDLASVRSVCSALTKPVNFMVGMRGTSFSVAELAAAGVKRISLSTSLHRAAMTGLYEAAREVQQSRTFKYVDSIMRGDTLGEYLRPGTSARDG